jgi:lipopolysaccharide heptosyltransferase I
MRILIVKLSSIGDVVHTLPAAAALRTALPGARLDWVVESRSSEILKGSPVIDALIEIETRAWRRRPLSIETLNEIRDRLGLIRPIAPERGGNEEPVDIAIDFQGLIKSGIVASASRASRRIGFETADLREKISRVFLTEQIQTAPFAHVIDKNLALARAALGDHGSDRLPYEFPIHTSPEDDRYADEAAGKSSPFAVINPGGGWPTKLWPPDRFGEIAELLWTEYRIESLVTFGPGEDQLALAVAASTKSGSAHPVQSTLKQFVALVRRAVLFVGSDTGPLHIAAACGTPIVGLYGPTSAWRNGPFNGGGITVSRDLWCRDSCHRRRCWHWECMDISVRDVAQAIEGRLERRGATLPAQSG